jgi:CubicO group peptidase (beta-lactamase class C family)
MAPVRLRRIIGTALAAVVATATLTACEKGSFDLDRVCDDNGCISLSKFAGNIDQALGSQAVGYVSIVGALAHLKEYGQARTTADAPARAMEADLPMNMASVSKVLTTIGVLQSLKANNLTIDSKISPYLPPDWTKGPNINTISFKDLLTHSAGFRVDGDGAKTTYDILKTQIQTGVTMADKADPKYNNLNFAIFRELLPFMEGFNDPGEPTRATATANFYVNYMKTHVFNPVGATYAECKPTGKPNQLLVYAGPGTNASGTAGGDWTAACGGGGWVTSPADLYKVMISLAGSTTLLTAQQKKDMNDNCLGWDCSVSTQMNFVGKNGSVGMGSGRRMWSFIGIFKGTVPVVLTVNSDLNDNITNIVAKAFANAAVPAP